MVERLNSKNENDFTESVMEYIYFFISFISKVGLHLFDVVTKCTVNIFEILYICGDVRLSL